MSTSVSVFLVEDETLIRFMTAEMVEELGHRVVAEAGSIEEGLPFAKSADFDLALLDISIGGIASPRLPKSLNGDVCRSYLSAATKKAACPNP